MISALVRRAAIRAAKAPCALSTPKWRRSQTSKTTWMRTLATKSDPPASAPEIKPTPDGEIPSIFDQATGLERAEIDYPDLFKHNEVLRGPFGTEDNPVKIQSHYDNRIVGCTGRPMPDEHDIVWLQVEKGEKACCRECGQYFVLDPL